MGFIQIKLASFFIIVLCVYFNVLNFVSPGKKELPDAKLLAEKLLMRRQFIPDPQGTSLMFAFFAQHFTHQFFKSDMKKGPAFTAAKGHGVSGADFRLHPILVGGKKAYISERMIYEWFRSCFQVDLSHIYGDSLERQHRLRLFKDGKLKYQV